MLSKSSSPKLRFEGRYSRPQMSANFKSEISADGYKCMVYLCKQDDHPGLRSAVRSRLPCRCLQSLLAHRPSCDTSPPGKMSCPSSIYVPLARKMLSKNFHEQISKLKAIHTERIGLDNVRYTAAGCCSPKSNPKFKPIDVIISVIIMVSSCTLYYNQEEATTRRLPGVVTLFAEIQVVKLHATGAVAR